MPHIREMAVQVMVGKGHVGGSISQHTHASSYVKLVYNVIQGADQHGYMMLGMANRAKSWFTGRIPVDFLELMKISPSYLVFRK